MNYYCKYEHPFNDKYYTILEKSYIIHTFQSMQCALI